MPSSGLSGHLLTQAHIHTYKNKSKKIKINSLKHKLQLTFRISPGGFRKGKKFLPKCSSKHTRSPFLLGYSAQQTEGDKDCIGVSTLPCPRSPPRAPACQLRLILPCLCPALHHFPPPGLWKSGTDPHFPAMRWVCGCCCVFLNRMSYKPG